VTHQVAGFWLCAAPVRTPGRAMPAVVRGCWERKRGHRWLFS